MDGTRRVARGAGLAFLGRLGAVVELLTFFVFTRLYGAPAFGLFVLFWSYVLILTLVSNLGMTAVLQRFVPGEEDEDRIHAVVHYAVAVPLVAGVALAALLSAAATLIAPLVNADVPSEVVARIIRVYAWSIPLWCIVESCTAAVRARHAFGPEIKIRIFYEQVLRLLGGVAFFYSGMALYGLFLSHLLALAIVAGMGVRLLGRHYILKRVLKPPHSRHSALREMLRFGVLMILPNISRKLHSNLPLLVINAVIPGAAGATAVAVYAVGRKIVSVLHLLRESFEHVLAPIATAERHRGDGGLQAVYAFATRMMAGLLLPVATMIVFFRFELLSVAGPAFSAASGVMLVLAGARILESLAGPANIVIAMIGRYRLPLLNAVGGLAASAVLLLLLVPSYGILGAAIAVGVGVNVTNFAALFELIYSHNLHPFDRHMAKFVAVSLALSLALGGLVAGLAPLGLAVKLTAGILGSGLVFYALIRLALTADRHRIDQLRRQAS